MGLRRPPRWEGLLGLALLGASLAVSGCAGFKAYEAPNHREEGPEKGLFTGSKGEFVIGSGSGSGPRRSIGSD